MSLTKYLKIIGTYYAIAFILTILAVWVSWEVAGYTYFVAGEPNRILRYAEYFFSFVAIIALILVQKQNYKLLGETK